MKQHLSLHRTTKTLTAAALILLMSGCASIVSKSLWPLTINTNPGGAQVEITNKKGNVVFNGTTPTTTLLKSKVKYFVRESYKVNISFDGYNEKIIPVECRLNDWYIGNIFLGGLIGWLIIDPITGAMYKIDREYINETLTPTTPSGQTSLNILNINDIPASMKENLTLIE